MEPVRLNVANPDYGDSSRYGSGGFLLAGPTESADDLRNIPKAHGLPAVGEGMGGRPRDHCFSLRRSRTIRSHARSSGR